MDNETERRFRRTHISKHDFERAVAFIAAARTHDVLSVEHEALLIAAIVYYARPFSSNEKVDDGQHPPSDPRLHKSLVKFDDADDLQLHRRIIGLRNKAVAHAEFSNYPVDRVGPAGKTLVSRPWHVTAEQLDLFRFECIAKAMESRCMLGVYEDVMVNAADTLRTSDPGPL